MQRAVVRMGVLSLAILLVSACSLPELPELPTWARRATPTPAIDVSAGPRVGGTLTLAVAEDVITFHPWLEVNNGALKPLLYEAPLRVTASGEYEPWLAAGWEEAEDGLSITLLLRPNVTFHNGRAMTADDVVWAVALAANQEAGHHLATRFSTIAGVVKLSESTVRISYRERSADQLDALTHLYLYPREAADSIDTVPVGTGPFRFVEWIPADRVTLARFDGYRQPGRPYLDEVVIRPIPDVRARLAALRSGAVDLLYAVPLGERVGLDGGLTVEAVPVGYSFYAFLMNVNVPPFDRVQVRQAMHHAIYRDEIAVGVFAGQAITTTLPLAVDSWAYAPELADGYAYDPERARELLAEAGYPGGFTVQMLVRDTSGPFLEQARIFQRQLALVGVEVELLPMPPAEYWPQLFSGTFAMVSHKSGGVGADPSALFESAACCRVTNSFFGVQDRADEWFVEYADAIAQARGTRDREVRAQHYGRALAIWQEQAWTLPTVWEPILYARWERVQAVRTDKEGALWLDETWLAMPRSTTDEYTTDE